MASEVFREQLRRQPIALPRLDNQAPPIIISEVTSRSHNKEPQRCLLSEERNPNRKNTQQSLVYFTFGGPRHPRVPSATGCAKALSTVSATPYQTQTLHSVNRCEDDPEWWTYVNLPLQRYAFESLVFSLLFVTSTRLRNKQEYIK
jgi:hypothetical protein